MAQPTNTFDSYDAIGMKESLSDRIYNVDPSETPVVSALGRGKASSTQEEWQTDALDTPGANAQIEGDDTTAAAVTPTVRLTNRTQIFKKSFTITETEQVVDKAGRSDEVAYQTMLKGKALKNDIEYAILQNGAKVTGNSTTARQLAGMLAWIATNTSFNPTGGGADPSPVDGTDARDDGTPRAFTEDLLKDVLQLMWDNGANVEGALVVTGSHNRGVFSSFTASTTQFNRAESGKLSASVRLYEGDFGTVKAVPCRHGRARDAWVLDTSMAEILELRPMKRTELAKTGDSDKFHIISELTLKVNNEKAHGLVADLTTS